jgi:hypothetical protein
MRRFLNHPFQREIIQEIRLTAGVRELPIIRNDSVFPARNLQVF